MRHINRKALSLLAAGGLVPSALTWGAPALTPAPAPRPTPGPAEASPLLRERIGGPGGYDVVAGEILVQLRPDADVYGLAARLGSRVLETSRWSGIHRLRVPAGRSVLDFQRVLHEIPEVAAAFPNAITEGTGVSLDTVVKASPVPVALGCYPSGGTQHLLKEWHLFWLDQAPACALYNPTLPKVVVAVLDTGVAYESVKSGTGSFVKIPDLGRSAIVSPYDMVQNDSHPNDDHMHGTHMAATVAAQGGAIGAAPQVSIMPIKVLDRTKAGTELDLIDGILYAADHGADVISMSLSFGKGYYPSSGLQDAIARAAEVGAVLVGSSGNEGRDGVGWPAAFPDVIAVGASRMGQQGDPAQTGKLILTERRAEYSNYGPALDVLAPGGRVDADLNWDGQPDGILAQTFTLGDPSKIGYWYTAGTSPAAAEVAGLAAWLIADGMSAAQVRQALTYTSRPMEGLDVYTPEHGSGAVDLGLARTFGWTAPAAKEAYVNITPWLEPAGGGMVRAAARVVVMDGQGNRLGGLHVGGSWYGSALEQNVHAETKAAEPLAGEAVFFSSPFEPAPSGVVMGFQVEALWQNGNRLKTEPQGFYSLSPASAEVFYQLMADVELSTSSVLFAIDDADDALDTLTTEAPRLDSYVSRALGAGLRSGPIALVMDQAYLDAVGDVAQDFELSWPLPLVYGGGSATEIPVRQVVTEKGKSVVILPMDPAMGQLAPQRWYPIVNAMVEDFSDVNARIGNDVPDPVVGDAFASSSLGAAFASSSLGDAFAASSLGDAFAASSLGDAFAASSLGASFGSATVGAAFASSSLGDAFAASSLGATNGTTSINSGESCEANSNGNGNGNGNNDDDAGCGDGTDNMDGVYGALITLESAL